MNILKKLLVLITFVAGFCQATENYLVILQSLQKPTIAQVAEIEQKMNTLGGQGFSPYLIQTDDYPPLRKGLWAVVLGQFDKQTAKAKQQRVKTWVKDAYIKTVQAPTPQSTSYSFATVETSLSHCLTAQTDEQTGGSNDLCSGFNGHRINSISGDARMGLAIYPPQTVEDAIWLPELAGFFPVLDFNYPLTWVYQGNQLIALSAVFVALDVESNEPKTNRYAVNVGKKQLCPVKKPFKVDDINAVLAYLNDNSNNCP